MTVIDQKEALRRQQSQASGQPSSSAQADAQSSNAGVLEEKERMRQQASQTPRAMSSVYGNPALAQSEGNLAIPSIEPDHDAPPTYGESHDHFQIQQPGFDTSANVTDDGRVNININTRDNRLADLLRPSILQQLDNRLQPELPPAYIPPSLGGQPGQAPPPRLNVVIQIVGSRGDVQPFVALGKVLKDTYGHRVRIATHPTFQQFVEENGLEFFSIGGDPAELMAFMVKHPGLMPGFDALKSGEVSKRRKGIAEMLVGCWRSCIEAGNGLGPAPKMHRRDAPFSPHEALPGDPQNAPFVADAIIANPPSFAHIHVAEKLGIPLHMMFTMPWSPTKAFPHPLANIQSSNADDVMTSYLSYTLVEMMTWQGLGDVINRFRENVLDIVPLSLIWAPGILTRMRIPYTYCWSPALIPKPNDWANNIDISGFYFLNLASSYTPDPELAAFLDAGPPPIYIGFGSIVMDDPDAMTRLIFEAVKAAGVRALVSKGWGGLGADELGVPDGVFMLGNVPHDWLFQRVSAVVHHGGAGTTAAGIQAGRPSIVIPSFGDQPWWGAMVSRAKAGPDPIPAKVLTAEKLTSAIKFCMQPDTQERAKELGQKISKEKGTDVGGQSFHSHLDMDKLRCALAPSRAAAWRVRRSEVPLSPFAAAVLVERNLLQYSDLKLYRPREYITEDQPPDPISAGASSLIMDISGISLAVADMPRSMFKTARSCSHDKVERLKEKREGSRAASRTNSRLGQVSSRGPSETDIPRSSSPESMKQEKEAPTERTSTSDAQSITKSEGSGEPTPGTMTPVSTAPTANSGPVESKYDGPNHVEACVQTGKGVGHIVGMGVRTPMNFCLGLAKGFRNLPRLYHDDMVRPMEKVTDFRSGVKVAGKEFGYGVFDGVSGLVTQPLHGAEKEGVAGLVKGFGKGIGGLITKPAAGFWGIPAYAMQGVNAEVNKLFARSSQNYIISSRMTQGNLDLSQANPKEKDDVVARWQNLSTDLKSFQEMKKKEHTAGKGRAGDHSPPDSTSSGRPSSPGFWHHRHRSFGHKKHGHGLGSSKDQGANRSVGPDADTASLSSMSSEEAEFEMAIRESVKGTSRGNAEEDAQIEAAIRQSVRSMRDQGQGLPQPAAVVAPPEKSAAIFSDKEYEITDEEYQALIEQAIQASVGGAEAGSAPQGTDDDDEELRRAIAASKEDAKQSDTRQTEEDIVMEYVKKQSLAEEEFRLKRAATGQKSVAEGTGDKGDDDADLKRALEESLSMRHADGAGPSGT